MEGIGHRWYQQKVTTAGVETAVVFAVTAAATHAFGRLIGQPAGWWTVPAAAVVTVPLVGERWFTTLDLGSAGWGHRMEERFASRRGRLEPVAAALLLGLSLKRWVGFEWSATLSVTFGLAVWRLGQQLSPAAARERFERALMDAPDEQITTLMCRVPWFYEGSEYAWWTDYCACSKAKAAEWPLFPKMMRHYPHMIGDCSSSEVLTHYRNEWMDDLKAANAAMNRAILPLDDFDRAPRSHASHLFKRLEIEGKEWSVPEWLQQELQSFLDSGESRIDWTPDRGGSWTQSGLFGKFLEWVIDNHGPEVIEVLAERWKKCQSYPFSEKTYLAIPAAKRVLLAPLFKVGSAFVPVYILRDLLNSSIGVTFVQGLSPERAHDIGFTIGDLEIPEEPNEPSWADEKAFLPLMGRMSDSTLQRQMAKGNVCQRLCYQREVKRRVETGDFHLTERRGHMGDCQHYPGIWDVLWKNLGKSAIDLLSTRDLAAVYMSGVELGEKELLDALIGRLPEPPEEIDRKLHVKAVKAMAGDVPVPVWTAYLPRLRSELHSISESLAHWMFEAYPVITGNDAGVLVDNLWEEGMIELLLTLSPAQLESAGVGACWPELCAESRKSLLMFRLAIAHPEKVPAAYREEIWKGEGVPVAFYAAALLGLLSDEQVMSYRGKRQWPELVHGDAWGATHEWIVQAYECAPEGCQKQFREELRRLFGEIHNEMIGFYCSLRFDIAVHPHSLINLPRSGPEKFARLPYADLLDRSVERLRAVLAGPTVEAFDPMKQPAAPLLDLGADLLELVLIWAEPADGRHLMMTCSKAYKVIGGSHIWKKEKEYRFWRSFTPVLWKADRDSRLLLASPRNWSPPEQRDLNFDKELMIVRARQEPTVLVDALREAKQKRKAVSYQLYILIDSLHNQKARQAWLDKVNDDDLITLIADGHWKWRVCDGCSGKMWFHDRLRRFLSEGSDEEIEGRSKELAARLESGESSRFRSPDKRAMAISFPKAVPTEWLELVGDAAKCATVENLPRIFFGDQFPAKTANRIVKYFGLFFEKDPVGVLVEVAKGRSGEPHLKRWTQVWGKLNTEEKARLRAEQPKLVEQFAPAQGAPLEA